MDSTNITNITTHTALAARTATTLSWVFIGKWHNKKLQSDNIKIKVDNHDVYY